ncbi:hypothetical protein FTUN_3479 [Frigoriglobus tundricola]|uniref:Uncharacterized protein n=1 Tax=Frigoriglobus tundricola TaxID=2774151 RepID=A0A6M5YPJ6_9BACT|nr:hypothetical protein FTUN_3479 [Frigoriglobus tundricola]
MIPRFRSRLRAGRTSVGHSRPLHVGRSNLSPRAVSLLLPVAESYDGGSGLSVGRTVAWVRWSVVGDRFAVKKQATEAPPVECSAANGTRTTGHRPRRKVRASQGAVVDNVHPR